MNQNIKSYLQRSIILCGAFAMMATAQISTPIKWACIGNSITQGSSGQNNIYPPRLNNLLGPQFVLENDGVSSTTLLKRGDFPYWTRGKLANVFAFRPDIITIKLGTNDTKPQNWQYNADFVKDLTALIDTLGLIPSKPQIWLCLPVPIFTNPYGINDSVAVNGVIPKIKQVAAAKGLNVIDLNTPLRAFPQLFYDGVHLTAAGSDSVASLIYRAFAAKAIRVACVGNSITQYVGAPNATAIDAYASKLNMLLGRKYLVNNYGVSGALMQKAAVPSYSYWTIGKIGQIFKFQPHIITIKLGTNDSRSQYWNSARFMTDSRAMIDTFNNNISPKPTIWPCYPVPAWQVNGQWPFNGINGNTIRDSVIPAVQQVATERNLKTINLYNPFLSLQSTVADGVHPNAVGQDTIAHIIYRALSAPVAINPKNAKGRLNQNKSAKLKSARVEFKSLSNQSHTLDGKSIHF